MRYGAVAAAVLGAVFLTPTGPRAGDRWPRGLAEAADDHRQTLNREQEAIRDGTLASPRGIDEAVQFDLQSHACHRGPAQAYREFGPPLLVSPQPAVRAEGAGAGGERVRVRYAFGIRFRQALTLEEMFRKAWKEGSDGILEVEFRRASNGWLPVSKRELLDRGDGAGKAGDPGAGRGTGKPR